MFKLFLSLIISASSATFADVCTFERNKQIEAETYCRAIGQGLRGNCNITQNAFADTVFEWRDYGEFYKVQWCFYVSCDGTINLFSPADVTFQLRVLKDCFEDPNNTQDEITIKPPTPPVYPTCSRAGSIIETANQVIGEKIPLVGLPFYLSHFSSRQQGRIADYISKFALTDNTFPARISGFTIKSTDKDNNLLSSQTLQAAPNLNFSFIWDGFNNGVETWGGVDRKIIIQTNVTSGLPVQDNIFEYKYGNLKSKKLGLGGWLPSIWSFYDSTLLKVYEGDGTTRPAKAVLEGAYFRLASSDGSEVFYYDQVGRIALIKTGLTGAIKYKFNYRTDEKIQSIIDSFQNEIKFIYDENGKINEIRSPENVITKLELDSLGNLFYVKNPKNEIYQMSYQNEKGLLTSFKKPNENLTTFNYDSEGKLILDLNSAGHSSALEKIDNGMKATSSMGRITLNIYDSVEKSETQINPSGLSVKYLNNDNESSTIAPHFNTKMIQQNDQRFGEQVKIPLRSEVQNFGTITSDFEQSIDLSDANNPYSFTTINNSVKSGQSEIQSQYDALTRTNTITSKLGRKTLTQLDMLERPILEQLGLYEPSRYFYSQDRLIKIKQGERELKLDYYPGTKLLKSYQNSENQKTSFMYDEAERIKAKIFPDGRMINYKYDSQGNLIGLTPPGKPEHKQIIGLNEKISSYNPPLLDGVLNVNTSYSYNLDRDLIKITRPDNSVINFNYGNTTGLLNSISGNFGVISREYQNVLPVKIKDQTNRSLEFAYIGNKISSVTAKTSTGEIFSKYNRAPSSTNSGQVGIETLEAGTKSQTIHYEYDDDNILVKAENLELIHHSPNGSLKETKLDNIKEEYFYNKFGEVKGFRAFFIDGDKLKLLYSYELKRDKSGRIIKKVESFGKSKRHSERDHKNHEKNKEHKDHHEHERKIESHYTYDKSGRLILVEVKSEGDKKGESKSIYSYDQNSNRISGKVAGKSINAVYDNQDRLIRYNNAIYSYNANGDLLSKAIMNHQSYQTTNYVYDSFGQLRQAGNVNYQTSLLQKRVAKIVGGVVKKYFTYNPDGKLLGELDSTQRLDKTFIYASKSHVPDYFIDSHNNSYKIITDHLGSIRLVVDSQSGEVVQKMLHDEFGVIKENQNPELLPFGFAGGLYDVETGLVRFGARDYDPETGRWMSKDPIRFDGGDANLYGYVLQDPVNNIDPPGTGPISGAICASASIAYDAVMSMPEIMATSYEINAYQQGINNVNHRLNNLPSSCGNDHPERLGLNNELTTLKAQLQAAQIRQSSAISSALMNTVGQSAICSALFKLPIP